MAVDGEIALESEDGEPLAGRHKVSIGGYTSRLHLGAVSVIDLGLGKGPQNKVTKSAPPSASPATAAPSRRPGPSRPSSAPSASGPAGSAAAETVRSAGGLGLTKVKLPGNPLGCMFWGDAGGTRLYTLDPQGTIRCLSFPDLKEKSKAELDQKCAWLAPSAEGLVVTLTDLQEVWVLDPEHFTAKQKIAIPEVKRAASAGNLSTAFASDGRSLYEVDLKAGRAEARKESLPGVSDPVVSPDGKYLFTRGLEQFNRFRIKDGHAKLEQEGPRIAQGRVDIGVQVSPDSRRVVLPSYAGNYGAGKYGNVFLYAVDDIARPELTLEFDNPAPGAISSDPVSGRVYAGALSIFDRDGKLLKRHGLDTGEVQQMLVHPSGGKLLLLATKSLIIEVPK